MTRGRCLSPGMKAGGCHCWPNPVAGPNTTEFPAGGDYALLTFPLQHSAETRWEFFGLKKEKPAMYVFVSSSNDYSKSGVSELHCKGPDINT